MVNYKTKKFCILYVDSSPNDAIISLKKQIEELEEREEIKLSECWNLDIFETIRAIDTKKKLNVLIDDFCLNKEKNIELILRDFFTRKYKSKFSLESISAYGDKPYEGLRKAKCIQDLPIGRSLMFFNSSQIREKDRSEHINLVHKVLNEDTRKRRLSEKFSFNDGKNVCICLSKDFDRRRTILDIWDKEKIVVYYDKRDVLENFLLCIMCRQKEIKNLINLLAIIKKVRSS